eukprot:1161628-Pelagomonas_calceolata.AAC.7
MSAFKAAHTSPAANISTKSSTLVSRPGHSCKRRSRRVAGAIGKATYEAFNLHPVNPPAPAVPPRPSAQPGTSSRAEPAAQPNAATQLDVLPVMTIVTETLASQVANMPYWDNIAQVQLLINLVVLASDRLLVTAWLPIPVFARWTTLQRSLGSLAFHSPNLKLVVLSASISSRSLVLPAFPF